MNGFSELEAFSRLPQPHLHRGAFFSMSASHHSSNSATGTPRAFANRLRVSIVGFLRTPFSIMVTYSRVMPALSASCSGILYLAPITRRIAPGNARASGAFPALAG